MLFVFINELKMNLTGLLQGYFYRLDFFKVKDFVDAIQRHWIIKQWHLQIIGECYQKI